MVLKACNYALNNLLITIIAFVSLFVFSCSESNNPLPGEFFGLNLNHKLAGTEAKEFIDRLHLLEVTPLKNEIGFYEGRAGKAVIYVTYYNNIGTAKEQEKKMTNAITPENPVFFGAESINIMGKVVYRCFGMGQTHFVFSNKNRLFWVSIDSHISRNFIEEYINYIER